MNIIILNHAQLNFDRQIDALVERYEERIPVDDMATMMLDVKATPCTRAYLDELNIAFTQYLQQRNWDKRRSGR